MKFWRCGLALAPMLLVCGASTAVDDLRNGTTSDFPPINYTHVGENANSGEYKVQTEANHASSMKALYALTNGFIDLIQGKEALPEGFIDINENNIIQVKWDTGKLLKHYGFLTTLSIVLLVLAVILPFIGCCVCRCISRKNRKYSKNLCLRKNLLVLALLLVFVLMVLGLSFATLSSLAVRRGTRELPDHLDNATEDLQVYSTGIIAEMDVLLIDNFHKLAEELISMLNRCSEWVINKLMEWGPRISDVFVKLEEMVNGLKDVEKSLGSVIEIVLSLKQEATIVDNEFSTIKDKLISALEFNGNEESKRIQDEIKSYSIKTAEILEKLPVDDVKNAQSKIKELFDKGILSKALKGREELEKIKSEIKQKVDLSVSKIVDNVSDVSQNLTEVFKNETKWINETLSELTDNHTKPAINDIRLNIDKYSAYWHIFGIVVCSTILVISVLVLFGAMCGMCDKNPKDYDKGCGSCFLTTAVWMIFCVTSVLVVLNVAHMLVGILSERMVCESLKNPRDSQIVQVASKTIYIGSLEYGSLLSPNWSLHDLIDSCRENNALAKGLKLEEATITGVWKNYTDSYDIDKRIDDLVNGINLNFDYELMNNGTKEQLREFANGAVNEINFEEIDKVLKQNFTGFDLHEFAEKLRSYSEKLPDGHPSRSEVVKCAQDLEKLGGRIVNMTNQGRGLIGTVERLREQIKFNATSIQEAIENLIEDVEGAQHWVNHNATTSIKELATIFGTSLKNRVDEFLTHVSSNVAQKVGRCAPLSNLYDATIVAGCDKILDPFNGYWLSIGWCLFLFVPMVIFSVKFISLQKRPYIDSKYLFVGPGDYQSQATIDPNNLRGMKKSNYPTRGNDNQFRRQYSWRSSRSHY